MDPAESKMLKIYVEKSIKWLVEKIIKANLRPLVVTLQSRGDDNKDILKAFSDRRFMSNVQQILKDNSTLVYLTPKFLEFFDFNDALDKPYLKSKVKFMSAQLGF